jgi:hypothetical protein
MDTTQRRDKAQKAEKIRGEREGEFTDNFIVLVLEGFLKDFYFIFLVSMQNLETLQLMCIRVMIS